MQRRLIRPFFMCFGANTRHHLITTEMQCSTCSKQDIFTHFPKAFKSGQFNMKFWKNMAVIYTVGITLGVSFQPYLAWTFLWRCAGNQSVRKNTSDAVAALKKYVLPIKACVLLKYSLFWEKWTFSLLDTTATLKIMFCYWVIWYKHNKLL